MHHSLGVVGLGHTSVGHVGRYTDLIECVLVPVAVSRGRPTWFPVSRHSCRLHQDRHPRASEAVSPGSNPPWRGNVYRLAPLLTGIPTRPEAFLEPQSVSGLQPCPRIHLKRGLGPHSSGWSDERQIPIFSQQSNLTICADTSICCTNTLI